MSVIVPGVEEAFNRVSQGMHILECAAADGARVEQREPRLDLVHPAAAGGREMEVNSGLLLEPAIDLFGLMRGRVVDDQVELLAGVRPGHQLEEVQELDRAVARGE